MPVGGIECEWRARARVFVEAWYRIHHPEWPLIVGECGEPWSKGAAVAAAFERSRADMLLLADADSYTDPDSIRGAVHAALTDQWAMPHWMVHRLSQKATENVYAGLPADIRHLDRGAYRGVKGGGIVAITRAAYETVDGIDPRFEGWGGEDIAFAAALQPLVGKPARLAGDLIHLWHPHPAPDLRGCEASEELVARYKQAINHPNAMRALIAERRLREPVDSSHIHSNG